MSDNKTNFSYDPLDGDNSFEVSKNPVTPSTDTTEVGTQPKRGRGRPPKNPKAATENTTELFKAPIVPHATHIPAATENTTGSKDPISLLLNYSGSKVLTVTPIFAKHVLSNCNQLNRKINKRWVKFLADSITRGEWQLNGESIIFSKDYRLIDGQHRLQAVVMANKPIDIYVTTDIDHKTFVSVDTGHSRSGSHVLTINNKVKHSFDVSATLNKLSRYNSKNFDFDGAHVISNRQLVSLLEKHKDVGNSVEFARKYPKGYSKSTIAFCHYILSSIDNELATKLFEQLTHSTPSIPLIAALRKGTIKEGKAKSRIKQTVVIGSIFKTWNAMRNNDVNASAIISATEDFPIPA